MIGFRPVPSARIQIRNDQGQKVGYLHSENGRQVFRASNGAKVATITKWNSTPPGRTGSCGGSFVPEDRR